MTIEVSPANFTKIDLQCVHLVLGAVWKDVEPVLWFTSEQVHVFGIGPITCRAVCVQPKIVSRIVELVLYPTNMMSVFIRTGFNRIKTKPGLICV